MADGVFNIAKGAVAEMLRDDATKLGVLLLKTVDSDANLRDNATVAAILAAVNVEANFTNYGRKTGITGTLNVDNTNDRVDCDLPDQVWAAAGGASNNTLAKLIIYYENTASDAGRVPLCYFDFVTTTDGSDLQATINAAGFYRAA